MQPVILIVVSAFLLVSVELVDSALSLNGFVSSFASPAAQQNRAAFVFHSPTFCSHTVYVAYILPNPTLGSVQCALKMGKGAPYFFLEVAILSR
jgi:hypothetical protein